MFMVLSTSRSSTPVAFIRGCWTDRSPPQGVTAANSCLLGISSAPEHFKKRMAAILDGCLRLILMMDAILILGAIPEEHNKRLTTVLRRLAKASVTLSRAKWIFVEIQVRFWSYLLNATGIRPNPAKISALGDMPPCNNMSDIRGFFAMASKLGWFSKSCNSNAASVWAPDQTQRLALGHSSPDRLQENQGRPQKTPHHSALAQSSPSSNQTENDGWSPSSRDRWHQRKIAIRRSVSWLHWGAFLLFHPTLCFSQWTSLGWYNNIHTSHVWTGCLSSHTEPSGRRKPSHLAHHRPRRWFPSPGTWHRHWNANGLERCKQFYGTFQRINAGHSAKWTVTTTLLIHRLLVYGSMAR